MMSILVVMRRKYIQTSQIILREMALQFMSKYSWIKSRNLVSQPRLCMVNLTFCSYLKSIIKGSN